MKPTIFLFIFLLIFTSSSDAQLLSADKLIAKWKISDTSQTRHAEETYTDLREHLNKDRLPALLDTLHQQINKKRNKRVEIRLLMYEILAEGNLYYQHEYALTRRDTLISTIRKANLLNDKQLMSELYSLFANVAATEYSPEEAILYYTKLLEIQEDIGAVHFPRLYRAYIFLSGMLQNLGEYRKAIDLGLRGLEVQESSNVLSIDKVPQYDIIGAAYKELNKPDSMLFYYIKAQESLATAVNDVQNKFYKEIWADVLKGGIGRAYFLQHRYDEAASLLEQNLASSIMYSQWSDAALVQNTLADIAFIKKQYSPSLAGWKQAYRWALENNDYKNTFRAALGIARVYQKQNATDSAFVYFELYNAYKDSLNAQNKASLLALANVQKGFNDLQDSLKKAQEKIIVQKYTRNTILVGVVLLFIIAALMYNRKRLKQKLEVQILKQQQQQAEQEIEQSHRQIEKHLQSISEKNMLINQLKQHAAKSSNEEEMLVQLNEYTLINEKEWEQFKAVFVRSNAAFITALHLHTKGVSPAEERLAILIYLKLGNHEIANVLGISKDSVARSKRRLRQRLQLEADVNLETFVLNM